MFQTRLMFALQLSSLFVTPCAIADQNISGTWVLRSTNGEPMGNMRITQSGNRIQLSGNGWTGTGTFNGTSGYYDWRYQSGKSGHTTLTFNTNTETLQGNVRGDFNVTFNGQKLGTKTQPSPSPGFTSPLAKSDPKIAAPEIVGDNTFRNLRCDHSNSGGSVRMYVPDGTTLLDHQVAHKMLSIGAEYIMKYCPSKGYYNLSVGINYKSTMEQQHALVSGNNYDKDKLTWQGGYRNLEIEKQQAILRKQEYDKQQALLKQQQEQAQLAQQQAIQAKRNRLLLELKESKVTSCPELSELYANPFLYENKHVASFMRFEKMIARDEALFNWGDAHVLVSNISAAQFSSTDTIYILVGEVQGNKTFRTPFGGEVMLPDLKFINTISLGVTHEELAWACAQRTND